MTILEKIRCIAIDDEPIALNIISEFARRMDNVSVVTFTNPLKALEEIRKTKPDVVFIDIEMKGMNGLEIARIISSDVMFIFTTAYAQFALDGFELNAIDFLYKPFSFNRFEIAVSKAIRQKDLQEKARHAEKEFFIVKSEYKNIKISYADIVFIEAMNNYVKIHLNRERSVMTQMSMKGIEEILPGSFFVRVHKSYIVNRTSIISFTKNDIMLAGNHIIPIGRAYSDRFINYMSDANYNINGIGVKTIR